MLQGLGWKWISEVMTKWSYYFSGILYGTFEKNDEKIYYKWLDPLTSLFCDYSELDEEKNKSLQIWANLDVLRALNYIKEYEHAFAGQKRTVKTELGNYSQREPGLYVQRNTILPTDILFKEGKLIAFICPARESCVVLVCDGYEKDTILSRWLEYSAGKAKYSIRFAGTFNVQMRDKIRLATDVYLPEGAQKKLPAVLVRTCYNKNKNKHIYYNYIQRGYAVVIQDVRGRDESEGVFIPMQNEAEDGDDTLNWIASQDWSNGKIGTIGASYLGGVQWFMAASENPHLAAIISIVTAGSAFVDLPRRGGLFNSGMLAWAFMMSERTSNPALMARNDWDELLNIRPLKDIAPYALGKKISFLDHWLAHTDNDDFWQKCDWFRHSSRRQIPALIMSGWFDDNSMGTAQAIELTNDYPAEMRKVILGAWNHNANSRYDIHGVPMGEQALRYDLDLIFLQWFDFHLRGIQNGIVKTHPVEYFTLTENRWKFAESWPPSVCKPYSFYLGKGGVLLNEPAESGTDSYTYDPQNPAIHVVDMSENELAVPEEYTEVEKRADVLCYTTAPLEKNITISGCMNAELFISSNAVDTDYIIRLTEVDEKGRSVKYADGMLGAKYRNSFETPDYLEKGKVYKLNIRTTNISKMFAVGNRIRLTVTSSAKNFAFPNSNTKGGYNSEKTFVAQNTVHYGAQFPSRIILPLEEL
jgi:putative CocE/NonD family hydrolase